MPIYEFVCEKCDRNFEMFVLSVGAVTDVRCPACGTERVRKVLSSFNCGAGAPSLGGSGQSQSCGSGASRFR